MATPADPIATAQDIAQESCLRIRMTDSEPERISQRQSIFVAARAVKEMCNNADEDEDVANLILYGALIVEYAANFFAENSYWELKRCVFASITILPLSKQSLTVLLRVLDKMEHIKNILQSMEPEYDQYGRETETLKSDLLSALARVRRLSHPPKSAS